MGKYANKRIGILGGTFNPIHNGHLHIAKSAVRKLRLDTVIFVPAYIPPHKKVRVNVPPKERLRMLKLGIGGEKKFKISLYEINRRGKSYSIKTARFLKEKYGKKSELFFLIGADMLSGLKKWHDIKGLFKILRFAVFTRPGFRIQSRFGTIIRMNIPGKRISSTGVRRLIKKGKSVKSLLPEAVYAYIQKNALYR